MMNAVRIFYAAIIYFIPKYLKYILIIPFDASLRHCQQQSAATTTTAAAATNNRSGDYFSSYLLLTN